MKGLWLVLAWVGALGAANAAPGFELSADGAYVIDTKAQLAWPRCVEGMNWNGATCAGEPMRLDHAEAQALAIARWKAQGVRWRLPTSHELQRLVDRQTRPSGLDPALFPGAPLEWHWSGSSTVKTAPVNPYQYDNVMKGRNGENVNRLNYLHGWAVHLGTGEAVGDASRRSRLPVRLVRPAL